jgi:C4-dicarboxylate transporter DctM subunit
MMWQQLGAQTLELGWDFYGSVILFVVLVALAVPVWAAIGAATITMLVVVGRPAPQPPGREAVLRHRRLRADRRSALHPHRRRAGAHRAQSKFLDVAEALTCWAKGGFGSATVLVCGMFAAISGSDAAGAAAVGRMTIDRLVESAIRVPMPVRWWPRGPVPAS